MFGLAKSFGQHDHNQQAVDQAAPAAEAHSHDHGDHDHTGHDHTGHDHTGHDHTGHDHSHDQPAMGQAAPEHSATAHAAGGHHEEFKADASAFHHISDLNVYTIGPWNLPLPCILYAPGKGLSMFSSGKFGIDNAHHGTGHKAVDGYVLYKGRVLRVADPSFPQGELEISDIVSKEITTEKGEKKDKEFLIYNGQELPLDKSSTADGGLFGGGITSFYDFSVTRNVAAMLLVTAFLAWIFFGMAKRYKQAPGTAPTGMQKLFEPLILFIQDEVAKPFIGAKYEQFMPLLLSLFFFILGLNLFGQIPFFGGANVTGNLAFTAVLAIIVFFVVNFNGNKHYWEHVFWMPGIPAWIKVLITPIEILGVFIKPLTLALRLFANITAGHIVIIIFVSLIFIFGKAGENPGAAWGASPASVILALFISAIELLVAFIQAYVFTLLTASYIGAATEEHHHAEAEHH